MNAPIETYCRECDEVVDPLPYGACPGCYEDLPKPTSSSDRAPLPGVRPHNRRLTKVHLWTVCAGILGLALGVAFGFVAFPTVPAERIIYERVDLNYPQFRHPPQMGDSVTDRVIAARVHHHQIEGLVADERKIYAEEVWLFWRFPSALFGAVFGIMLFTRRDRGKKLLPPECQQGEPS